VDGNGSTDATHEPDSSRLRDELVVQEYLSLRNESLAAKQNQQSVLQWSMATVGIGVAAVFATSAVLFDPKTHARQWILIADVVIFGIAIPVLAALAFAIWLGELERMERAGMYLRAKEQSVNGRATLTPASLSKPHAMDLILWESMLAHPGRSNPYRKNRIGAGASCLLFSAVFGGSLASAVFILVGSGTMRTLLQPTGQLTCVLIAGVAAVGFAFWFGKQVLAFNRGTRGPRAKSHRLRRLRTTGANRASRTPGAP
jgi:uncharacterized membrane protein YbhN (UPF0104 family)